MGRSEKIVSCMISRKVKLKFVFGAIICFKAKFWIRKTCSTFLYALIMIFIEFTKLSSNMLEPYYAEV